MFAVFIFEVDISEPYLMTSAENSVREPPNLKISWGRIPADPPYKVHGYCTGETAPVTNNLATALLSLLSGRQVTFSKAPTRLAAKGFTSVERSLSLRRCIRYLYLIYCSIVYLMNPLVLAS